MAQFDKCVEVQNLQNRTFDFLNRSYRIQIRLGQAKATAENNKNNLEFLKYQLPGMVRLHNYGYINSSELTHFELQIDIAKFELDDSKLNLENTLNSYNISHASFLDSCVIVNPQFNAEQMETLVENHYRSWEINQSSLIRNISLKERTLQLEKDFLDYQIKLYQKEFITLIELKRTQYEYNALKNELLSLNNELEISNQAKKHLQFYINLIKKNNP